MAALMRIIRLEAKKVRTKENGSFRPYDWINTDTPNAKKKHPAMISRTCLITQNVIFIHPRQR